MFLPIAMSRPNTELQRAPKLIPLLLPEPSRWKHPAMAGVVVQASKAVCAEEPTLLPGRPRADGLDDAPDVWSDAPAELATAADAATARMIFTAGLLSVCLGAR